VAVPILGMYLSVMLLIANGILPLALATASSHSFN